MANDYSESGFRLKIPFPQYLIDVDAGFTSPFSQAK
jgi:hypothetical protein